MKACSCLPMSACWGAVILIPPDESGDPSIGVPLRDRNSRQVHGADQPVTPGRDPTNLFERCAVFLICNSGMLTRVYPATRTSSAGGRVHDHAGERQSEVAR